MTNNPFIPYLVVTLFSFTLIGCGGSSSSSDNPKDTLDPGGSSVSHIHGTAAIGAPYTGNDTIHINCKGNSVAMVVDADNKGNFALSKEKFDSSQSELPCLITTQSGSLTSYTNQSGRINLTPFTSLAFNRAVMDHTGQALGMLEINSLDPTVFAVALKEATTNLETALKKAANQSTVPFDIFTEVFKADHNSQYDRWLDGFGKALVAHYSGQDLDFLEAFTTGFSLSYSTQNDPSDFNETTSSTFQFIVAAPTKVAQHYNNLLEEGEYTLEIGIVRVGSLDPINEVIEGKKLPNSASEICNKVFEDAVLIITNGQNLNAPFMQSCAWADSPQTGYIKQLIVQYPPHGQAVFSWQAL